MKRLPALSSIGLLVFFGIISGFNAAEAAPSSAPYQAYRYVHCNPNGAGVDCPINFPTVTANHRIELSHVSCYVSGAGDISLDFVQLIVLNARNVSVAAVTLLVTQTGEGNVANPMNNARDFSALADTAAFTVAGAHFQTDARTARGFISLFACNLEGRYLTLS